MGKLRHACEPACGPVPRRPTDLGRVCQVPLRIPSPLLLLVLAGAPCACRERRARRRRPPTHRGRRARRRRRRMPPCACPRAPRQAAPSPVKACRTPAEMPFVVAGQDHRGQVAASCPLWGPAPVQGGAECVGEVAMVVSATASPTPWFPGGGGGGAAGSDSDAGSTASRVRTTAQVLECGSTAECVSFSR